MNLNGKALELFEDYIKLHHGYDLTMTTYLKEVLLNALIIEWLDSIGYYVEPLREEIDFGFILHNGNPNKPIESISGFKTRPEAISKAIEKCNELINLK